LTVTQPTSTRRPSTALLESLLTPSDDVVVLEPLFSFSTTVVFTTIGWILAMSRIQ